MEAHLRTATRAGAHVRFGTPLKSWSPTEGGFAVQASDGTRLTSRALVLSLGPWFEEALGVPLRIQRNVQAWFTPTSDAYRPGRFPPFLVERANLPAPLYGFPDFGEGVKAAFHAHGDITSAAQLEREIDPARDIEPIVTAM